MYQVYLYTLWKLRRIPLKKTFQLVLPLQDSRFVRYYEHSAVCPQFSHAHARANGFPRAHGPAYINRVVSERVNQFLLMR